MSWILFSDKNKKGGGYLPSPFISKRASITCPTGLSRSSDMPVSAFIARGLTYAVSLTRLSGTGFLPAPGLDPPLGICYCSAGRL